MNKSNHFKKALEKGFRYDKRKLEEYRDISIEYGVSQTAEGSARVRIGDTEVIAGVKMSIEKPYPDSPDRGNLSVNVELLPASGPEFEIGPPGMDAIEIARVTDRGIRESGAVDFKKLCINPGEDAWTIFVDVCSVNYDGNLMDACSLAALAAVKDARFPEVIEGAINYKKKSERKIEMKDTPVEVTVYRVGKFYIVDPNIEEEELYDARLTVAVLESGDICALQKGGEGTLTIEDVDKMVSLAIEKSKDLRAKLG